MDVHLENAVPPVPNFVVIAHRPKYNRGMKRLQATVSIYALFDPRNPDVIRYVGKTSKSIEFRRTRHVGEARRGLQNHRGNWIRSLLSEGVIPSVRLLSEVPTAEWQEGERYFISLYRDTLVNGTDGGEGLENPSDETRKKMSDANKGKPTPEHVRKIRSENAKSRKWSEETKLKMSESKKRENLSEETRRKRSDANRNRTLSPETREKIAAKQRAYHERRRASAALCS